jgi:hypothetical protein
MKKTGKERDLRENGKGLTVRDFWGRDMARGTVWLTWEKGGTVNLGVLRRCSASSAVLGYELTQGISKDALARPFPWAHVDSLPHAASNAVLVRFLWVALRHGDRSRWNSNGGRENVR